MEHIKKIIRELKADAPRIRTSDLYCIVAARLVKASHPDQFDEIRKAATEAAEALLPLRAAEQWIYEKMQNREKTRVFASFLTPAERKFLCG